MSKLHSIFAVVLLASVSWSVQAAQMLCVFDLMGASGDAFSMSKDYVVAMQRHNVDIQFKAYTNEALATEDFRTGKCDAVIATALRTRQFNGVAAAIDSMGATTIVRNGKVDMVGTYQVLRALVQTYAAPSAKVTSVMRQGGYEVGGIVPIGAAYPFVKDRRINSVEALAGKRIAAFDHDKAQAVMIERMGALAVSADISNFHTKFNNGLVDMIAAPSLAYKPLELHRGLGSKGAVVRFPIMILTYQVILNRRKFPEGFGQWSREYWLSQFDRVLQLVKTGDASIPPAMWSEITPESAFKYTLMLREARISLAQQGLYDKRGLSVIKRIRCHVNPDDPECVSKSEEDWK